MESEYLALTDAAKEAVFLRRLLTSLNFKIEGQPLLIKSDSDSALKHVKNNINHPRTKHINRRHHYIREIYIERQVDLEHVPAVSQTADILTKPLDAIKHTRAVNLLHLQTCFISV
jgi:hypothetical protein